MAKIYIKGDSLRQQLDGLEGLTDSLGSVKDRIGAVRNGLSSVTSFHFALERSLKNTETSVGALKIRNSDMKRTLEMILFQYAEAENRVLDNAGVQAHATGNHINVQAGADGSSDEVQGQETPKSIAWISGAVTGAATVGGVRADGSLSGEVGGASYEIKHGFYNKNKKNEKTGEMEIDSLGVEESISGEIHLLKGGAKGNWGYLYGDAEAEVGKVSGIAAIGACLFKDGVLSPQIYGKLGASAEGITGSANLGVGSEENNIHGKAEGTVGKAEVGAEAGIGRITYEDEHGNQVSGYGVQGKVSAEAYAVEGEVSCGFTLMGIDFDIGVEGKAGGAGVEAGGQITTGGVSGSIGAGAGVGAGLNVSIDWSDFKWPW